MLRIVALTFMASILVACGRTPNQLDLVSVKNELDSDLATLGLVTDKFDNPITLYEAIARAILYNREYKLATMEAALSQRQLDLANINMLPALTLNAGYTSRNKFAASTSVTFDGDTPLALEDGAQYSVSQDKQQSTSSAEFSWNILDFGLSYVRAGQSADRRMIAIERQRKVVHNIVREVTASYWRAVAADNLLDDLAPLMRRLDQALEDSRRIERRRLKAPIDALIYQKELLEIRRTLYTQQRILMTAKLELAQLMGLMPGQRFELAKVRYIIPNIAMGMTLMEETALLRRPELMEARYQSRINRSEVRAAMLSMFPGINLSLSANSTDNDYQKYQNYTEMGAQMSWNLMSVFSAPAQRRLAKASVDVAEQQRLALAMAVISQVHIANMNFVQARQEYATAEDFLSVSQRLTKQTRDAQKVAKFGELEVIRQEASLLLAQMRRDIAFAELQNSFGTVYASIGMDIVPDHKSDMTLAGLTENITASLQNWGLKYRNVVSEGRLVKSSISSQNPVLGRAGFSFAADTFDVGTPVAYIVTQQDGSALPDWLTFDEGKRLLSGTPPRSPGQLNIRVVAQGPKGRAADSFILQFGKPFAAVPKPAPAAQPPAPQAVPVEPVLKRSKDDNSKTAYRFVQAKALSSLAEAKTFAANVERTTGLRAFVRKTKSRKPALYRIIIPAYARGEIAIIRQSLSGIGITDSFVTKR